ncbi:MAG: hypothetical protein JWO05_666 [Gemmatimonadetes bacterium]|nr:hypothetical protein [Gemmatimonadota bacterium]
MTAAIVRMPIAPMHAEARVSSGQLSQCLAGHRVEVLEEQDDWRRVRSEDGYEGWIHLGYLTLVPPSGTRGSAQVARLSLGCVTRDATGGRRALPLGAYLSPEEMVKSGEALRIDELPTRFPPDPTAITRSAQELFENTGYQWGGITPWGADCSGFVQSVYRLHGITLSRDASQQFAEGTEVANGIEALKAGDLAFFSDREDRRITHVGIALGGKRLVHLALGRGGYAVERLDEQKDAYVQKLVQRYVGARRVV